ncbi:neuropeptide Y receptor type 1 [Contarinia nasturtii]|uniref:neuropeptide Y receptor type 1 n=1 Tax=Contarinia nasturtii TaxID=265458 RepID=UPI0012D4713D|nr:neuropeptide Y receptor type 1 [Contarinia nasturtii]
MASTSNNSGVDYAKYDFPREIWFVKPTNEIVCKLLVLVPIIFCGVAMNVLLLNIIIKNRALHTPTNYILSNMIVADTLMLLVSPVLLICFDLFQNFILGPIGCKIGAFIQVTFLLTSVLSLCVVSYDRLTAIVLPMEKRITMRGAKMTMLFTWMVGLTTSIPFAVYRNYMERKWKNFVEQFCVENMIILPIYWHIILILLVLCPLIVMIICYSAIFWKLDRYEQKVLKHENSITISYKTKVARMLFILVSVFILLHIPFTVFMFKRSKLLEKSEMNQVDDDGGIFYILFCFSYCCLYLNAAINPIIYGLTNDNFRRAYHQTPIIPRQLCRLLHAIKQLKSNKTHSVEKPNIDVQPIIYRLTQETVLNPTSIKSATHSSQATVTPNINDNDSSANIDIAYVTDTTTVAAAVAVAVAIIDNINNNNKAK